MKNITIRPCIGAIWGKESIIFYLDCFTLNDQLPPILQERSKKCLSVGCHWVVNIETVHGKSVVG